MLTVSSLSETSKIGPAYRRSFLTFPRASALKFFQISRKIGKHEIIEITPKCPQSIGLNIQALKP